MRAWTTLCAAAAALALLAALLATSLLPSGRVDWQADLVWHQPWRLWTGALVHWSWHHLLANLAGCLVLALLGWASEPGGRAALAWFIAWPLTQLGLLLQPGLHRYGGLSGVLHAGVAVLVVMLWQRKGRERALGAAIGLGLVLKLLSEQPLGAPLRTVIGWDVPIAPFAHLSGAAAGLLCGLILLRGGKR